MSAWRRVALDLFPESSAQLETGDLIEAQFVAGGLLREALQAANHDAIARSVRFVTWLNRHSKDDEQLLHAAISILGDAVKHEPLRHQLWSSISQTEFADILPLCSGVMQRDVSKEFEREFRFAVR